MNNGDFYLTPEEDRARIALVRRTIGPDKILMVDMNCTWDMNDVLKRRISLKKIIFLWWKNRFVPMISPDISV